MRALWCRIGTLHRAHKTELVIAKMDRLARNQAFLMSLVDSSVDVRFCDFPDIPAGAVGRFMLQQTAAVAELEAVGLPSAPRPYWPRRSPVTASGIATPSTT